MSQTVDLETLKRAALPPTWRADRRRALGAVLGQLPWLALLCREREDLVLVLASALLTPALIAFMARSLAGAAGVLFATGLGVLAALPHAGFDGSGPERWALLPAGALAGLLALAGVRWRLGALWLGLVAALGLLVWGLRWESLDLFGSAVVLITGAGAGCGARVADRWPGFNAPRLPVDLCETTRLERSLRRGLTGALAVLPLALVGLLVPDQTPERIGLASAAVLLSLAPGLVAWAADEESTPRLAALTSLLAVTSLTGFAVLQARVWGYDGVGELHWFEAAGAALSWLSERWAPVGLAAVTLAGSSAALGYARRRAKEPAVSLWPACLYGAAVWLYTLLAEFVGRPFLGSLPESILLAPAALGFVWLCALAGLEEGDRWLARRARPGLRL